MSLETLARITVLEQELAELKQSIASDTEYGLAKVTNATDVTEENGIALSAVQNNASVDGTLRNIASSLNGAYVVSKYLTNTKTINTDGWQEIAELSYTVPKRSIVILCAGLEIAQSVQGFVDTFLFGKFFNVYVSDRTRYQICTCSIAQANQKIQLDIGGSIQKTITIQGILDERYSYAEYVIIPIE